LFVILSLTPMLPGQFPCSRQRRFLNACVNRFRNSSNLSLTLSMSSILGKETPFFCQILKIITNHENRFNQSRVDWILPTKSWRALPCNRRVWVRLQRGGRPGSDPSCTICCSTNGLVRLGNRFASSHSTLPRVQWKIVCNSSKSIKCTPQKWINKEPPTGTNGWGHRRVFCTWPDSSDCCSIVKQFGRPQSDECPSL